MVTSSLQAPLLELNRSLGKTKKMWSNLTTENYFSAMDYEPTDILPVILENILILL